MSISDQPHSSQLTDPCSPVTLVVLCYNHEAFVQRALESVAEQTLRPCHLVVVDDASDDASALVISRFLEGTQGCTTVLLHQTNRGLLRSLNETLALVDSTYVAFMGADDWMEPERFELQVRELERRGIDYAAAHSAMTRVDEQGAPLPLPPTHGLDSAEEDAFLANIRRTTIGAPSVLLRTSAVRAVGGYDEELPMEDYDLWLRLLRRYRVCYVDSALVNYRVVSTSLSNTTDIWEYREWHLRSLAKHLDLPGERGDAVQDRMAELTKLLYFRGRSARLTRRDLLLCFQRRPDAETAALAACAFVGLRGPTVERTYGYILNLLGRTTHVMTKNEHRRRRST